MVSDAQRTLVARCYVAIAEMDHDIAEWVKAIHEHRAAVNHHVAVWQWETLTRRG